MPRKELLLFTIKLFVFVLFLITSTSAVLAAAFTAEFNENSDGKTQISKFYLQDHLYRIDLKEDGIKIAIIVNRKTGKTDLLNLSGKTFLQINNDDPKSLLKNPFEAYQHMAKKYTISSTGTEQIQDIKCNKQEIKSGGKVMMTAWVSKKYNFPLKTVNPTTNYVAQLSKIINGPVDKSIFKVPSGFTQHEVAQTKTTAPKKPKPMKFDIFCSRVESCWEKQLLKSYRNYIML